MFFSDFKLSNYYVSYELFNYILLIKFIINSHFFVIEYIRLHVSYEKSGEHITKRVPNENSLESSGKNDTFPSCLTFFNFHFTLQFTPTDSSAPGRVR